MVIGMYVQTNYKFPSRSHKEKVMIEDRLMILNLKIFPEMMHYSLIGITTTGQRFGLFSSERHKRFIKNDNAARRKSMMMRRISQPLLKMRDDRMSVNLWFTYPILV